MLPFTPKAHAELKGKTIGEAFAYPVDTPIHKWAFGMLMNYKAEPWMDNEGIERPPSKLSLEFAVAAANWRRENNKEQPGE